MKSGYTEPMQRDHVLDIDARHSRLATWGTPPDAAFRLAARIVREFGRVTGEEAGGVPLDQGIVLGARSVRVPDIPESRITGELADALARCAPLRTDADARRALSLGKSYPDLLAARSNRLDRVADAVVRPRTQQELEHVILQLADQDVAVVPVGGGTSVVGGIEPIGTHADQPVIAIDLSDLNRMVDIDSVSGVATFEAGIRGPRLEAALAPHGLTLGHVPQSFELATLGGWIATRSAGQGSLRFGKIESMVGGMRVITPSGVITVDHVPAHGAGPDMREFMTGSEGTCGVIGEATMRVVPRPSHVRFATYLHPDFASAADAARTLVQSGIRPTMVRVSDSHETAFSIGGSTPEWLRTGMTRRVIDMLGMGTAAMTIVLTTGASSQARATERLIDRHMRSTGGRSIGPIPAHHWYRARFIQPYARDILIDQGLLVDTLETSAPWRVLPSLHRDVRDALEGILGPGRTVVGCHLSHLYRDGASAYFTFIARVPQGEEIEVWRRAKRAVHEALAQHRAAVSHQHGVGTMHRDLYEQVTPHQVLTGMRRMREACDPNGIMNPGKLFAPAAESHGIINTCGAR